MRQIAKAISSGDESRLNSRSIKDRNWPRRFAPRHLLAIFVVVAQFLLIPMTVAKADPLLPGGDNNCGAEQYFNRELQLCFASPRPSPIADAGSDQSVESGAVVTLQGGATITLGEEVTYVWNVTSDEYSAQYVNSLTAALANSPDLQFPTFTAPTLEQGAPDLVLTFSLSVSVSGYGMSEGEFLESTSPATVHVTVKAPHDTSTPAPPMLASATPDHGPVTGGTSGQHCR